MVVIGEVAATEVTAIAAITNKKRGLVIIVSTTTMMTATQTDTSLAMLITFMIISEVVLDPARVIS
jgi:hypothetical protein